MPTNKIRIGSVNLGRGYAASVATLKECLEDHVDILLLQEPYRGVRHAMECGRIYSKSRNAKAAVLVLNSDLRIVLITGATSDKVCTVNVHASGQMNLAV